MKTFTDAIALRMAHLGFAVLDTFDLQVEFILVVFQLPFIFSATIR